jgi:hypothetical protein
LNGFNDFGTEVGSKNAFFFFSNRHKSKANMMYKAVMNLPGTRNAWHVLAISFITLDDILPSKQTRLGCSFCMIDATYKRNKINDTNINLLNSP